MRPCHRQGRFHIRGQKKYSSGDKISLTILCAPIIMSLANVWVGGLRMGYYLLDHGGSADHGSEERLRGICRVLPERPEVHTFDLEEDWHYGIGAVAELTRQRPNIKPEDWCVTARLHGMDKLCRRAQTVLWGWPPEMIDRRKARELGRLHRIVVTEDRTMALLRSAGVEKNVRLGPDPAFLVERQLRPLGGAFRQDTVGLCLSPTVCRFEVAEGLLFRSYCHLIRWILEHTTWKIALIPYCAKAKNNDCLLHAAIKRQFSEEIRVFCRGDGDCRVLRGDLSMCRCCVGTAGVLTGWSCGVPGLCVGASSRGLGLSERLFGSWHDTVVWAGGLNREDDLTERFRGFLKKEDALRRRLGLAAAQYHQWAADWSWSDIA